MSAAKLEEICAEIRRGQNVIVRAEHTLEAKKIYETLHPETKQGGAPGKPGGGKAKSETVSSFAKYIAERTHRSKRAVEIDVQIAIGIAPEIRERLRDTKHASATRTLAYLAQHPDEQTELVEKFFDALAAETASRARGRQRDVMRAWKRDAAWHRRAHQRLVEAQNVEEIAKAIRKVVQHDPAKIRQIEKAVAAVREELAPASVAEAAE
jgi:hypothetical protein